MSGVGSMLPSRSTARTISTWAPSAGSGIVTVYGDVHGAKSPASRAHSNVAPGGSGGSNSATNSNVAVRSVVGLSGPTAIAVSGAVRSTIVNRFSAGVGSTWPSLVDGAHLQEVLAG